MNADRRCPITGDSKHHRYQSHRNTARRQESAATDWDDEALDLLITETARNNLFNEAKGRLRRTIMARYACERISLPSKEQARPAEFAGNLPEQYREKWAFPKDYPMVAPSYSASHSRLAKISGLGRKAESRSEPEKLAAAKRRKLGLTAETLSRQFMSLHRSAPTNGSDIPWRGQELDTRPPL